MANIRILSDYAALMDSIAGKNKAFETMAHAAVFSAGLAFSKKGIIKKNFKMKNVPENREIRDVVLDKFHEQIDMLSMAHTGSHEILKNQDDLKVERYKILELYANEGLAILDKIKGKNPTDLNGIDTVIQELSSISAEINKKDENLDIEEPDF